MQISCAVTAQMISAFDFASWIVQSFFVLNQNFQASSYLGQFVSDLVENKKDQFSPITAHFIACTNINKCSNKGGFIVHYEQFYIIQCIQTIYKIH